MKNLNLYIQKIIMLNDRLQIVNCAVYKNIKGEEIKSKEGSVLILLLYF